MSASHEADRIQEMGQRFGLKMSSALEATDLDWESCCEQFEITLQEVGERLSLSDAPHDLFMSEARLSFFGLMTDRQNVTQWTRARDAARADYIAELKDAEADDVAAHRFELAREERAA